MYLSDIYTVSANLTGTPGISVPCGFSSEGLPIGLQLVGNYWSEDILLNLANVYENEFSARRKTESMRLVYFNNKSLGTSAFGRIGKDIFCEIVFSKRFGSSTTFRLRLPEPGREKR